MMSFTAEICTTAMKVLRNSNLVGDRSSYLCTTANNAVGYLEDVRRGIFLEISSLGRQSATGWID